jgi:hypothetical protein
MSIEHINQANAYSTKPKTAGAGKMGLGSNITMLTPLQRLCALIPGLLQYVWYYGREINTQGLGRGSLEKI